ncbi:MAG: hypothetical protein ACD_51C00194G0002 [uncultured bacterium]|nr:MAG: hypothetical protein ACD_51C00194G0002 [uncultured bacterium]OGJ48119.1 MAG: hypothetical protein A2244_01370 [Candidatus Peregrinibacteria bacterium RIFOXYA2_FULL_41_18]OGJ53217.1 MAG: hypothetical protein A2448_04790 [Candidatus Peregrinibacteria bacterium RIFOXYC2_FULL_41_22]
MEKISKQKAIIGLTVLVDVIGLGVVIPVLPYYVRSFGAEPFTITLLFTVFSFCSFFSAPLLGSLSDKVGRRPMLILSILSTSIGWFVFAGTHSIIGLFIGRAVDGLAAGNFPIAQSYLLDISKTDKEKSSNLGMIGAIFGIGFIVGPMLGGLLSSFSHTTPFWFVGFLAMANAILAYFILPETNSNLDRNKKVVLNPFTPLIRSLGNKTLILPFLAWFAFGLGAVNTHSIFALYIQDVFGFGSVVAGIFMTCTGLVLAFNQGFLLKRFWLKNFKEKTLEMWGLLVFGIGFLLMSTASLSVFIIGIAITTFAQSILRIVMTNQITAKADQNAKGETLGVLSSVMSLAMIVGPIAAGFLFEISENIPFLVSTAILIVAFMIVANDRRLGARALGARRKEEELITESLEERMIG